MPRRPRRAEEEMAPRPGGLSIKAPEWAQAPGFEVRTVGGAKEYRCPGCDHIVKSSVQHLVVVPVQNAGERRHWHTECWRRELRRLGI